MFKPGIEVLLSQKHVGKKAVGVVCNNTSRDHNGRHTVDILSESGYFKPVRIFTPEHGFDSLNPDGEHVGNSKHKSLGVDIISLYGVNKSPSEELLSDLDLLIYDIQDVGVRFYTYISTLRNVLDVASKVNLPVVVADRPDPTGSSQIEGPMLESGFESFVGNLPLPVKYGMTPGELALWWKFKNNLQNEITVACCEDYKFDKAFSELRFPWFQPSPSMPSFKTALFYPGTCLFEGTRLSEGRGTRGPFQNIGAPDVNSERWLEELEHLSGMFEISIEQSSFIPVFGKFAGKECYGIKLDTSKTLLKNPFKIALEIMYAFEKTHPGKIEFSRRGQMKHYFIDYLAGTDKIRKSIISGTKPEKVLSEFEAEIELFKKEIKPFLLYERKLVCDI